MGQICETGAGIQMDTCAAVFISLCASVLGAICGIGGGVLTKPILDAMGIMPVGTTGFLTGCTVLIMSAASLIKSSTVNEANRSSGRVWIVAAAGASGGAIGRQVFQHLLAGCAGEHFVSAIQSGVLLLLTVGTLAYTANRRSIRRNTPCSGILLFVVGMLMGFLAAFLGIGGGPFNLVVLMLLLPVNTKQAAGYSLHIILASQSAGLLLAYLTRTVPDFDGVTLVGMCIAGFIGGIAGSSIRMRLKEQQLTTVFQGVLIWICLLSVFSIYKALTWS